MNWLDKIRLEIYKFWKLHVVFRYNVALVGWAKHDYRLSWKFKERYNILGLAYASDYEKHISDIMYHMNTCPFGIKVRLFVDSSILFKDLNQIPYYYY